MIRTAVEEFHNLQPSRSTPVGAAITGSVFITDLSFGRAEGYCREGGQPVISDDSSAQAPLDLAYLGLCPTGHLRDGMLCAAYTISARKLIRVRIALRCQPSP